MKNKKGASKKIAVFVVVSMIILLAVVVFAQTANNSDGGGGLTSTEKQEVSKKVDEVANPKALANETKKYVEKFIEKRGIKAEQVNEVSEVDFGSLPDDVSLENVNDANLAIYEVDYNESNLDGEQDRIFVITYSDKKIDSGDIIADKDKRQFLHFGLSDETFGSVFLETATGVPGSIGVGYVMLRHGSITGLSTNLEVTGSQPDEQIEILVYKNDEVIRFGNEIFASLDGVKKDYDLQSKGVVEFEPGDVLSVFVNTNDIVQYKNVITMVEITTVE